jgi:hypothetical protein
MVTETEPSIGVEPERDVRRRRLLWLAIGGVLAAAAGVGVWLWTSSGSTEPSPTATGPDATATVRRGTIAATDSWDGTLERGDPFTVTDAGGSATSVDQGETGGGATESEGTITRLVAQGETVGRGDELYRVNEQPVTLLYGAVPMYRDLAPGDSGVDVRQLERNLLKLGYAGFTADNDYTSFTGRAVRAWQADIGTAKTGTVSRGDVVFFPEEARVGNLNIEVGAPVSPGTPVLDITGSEQVVSFEVDVADRGLVGVGTDVRVSLPDGEDVRGTVSEVVVAGAPPADTATDAESATADGSIAQVEVALAKRVPDELVGASVDVIVAIDKRKDVLVVPVNALLAVAEGGFGLEVVDGDGTTEIVRVTTGLFGDGKVEVRSKGINDGTVVGTAGR